MSAFDSVAATFERDRALPEGVPGAIRAAVLEAGDAASPRLLDLGAGTGRIGWPFVEAGDDYVGIDLSLGNDRHTLGKGTEVGPSTGIVRWRRRSQRIRFPRNAKAVDLRQRVINDVQ